MEIRVDDVVVRVPDCLADDAPLLREYHARLVDERERTVGSSRGWWAPYLDGQTLAYEADAVSVDAARPGATLPGLEQHLHADGVYPGGVLIVDRMQLEPEMRGRRRAGALITSLASVIFGDEATVVVVLEPEPQEDGGPMEDGSRRDIALRRLCSTYEAAGMRPWLSTSVWWGLVGADQ